MFLAFNYLLIHATKNYKKRTYGNMNVNIGSANNFVVLDNLTQSWLNIYPRNFKVCKLLQLKTS